MFVAALVALNRLHTEQEIVVCFAGGMSRWRVISPAMRLARHRRLPGPDHEPVHPAAFRGPCARRLFAVRTDLAATLVREGEFTEPAPGRDRLRPGRSAAAGNDQATSSSTRKPNGRADVTYTADQGRHHQAQRRARC